MNAPCFARRRGFTMMEVLIVLGLLALLLAFLAPVIQRFRESSTRAQASNNLRQIGIGLHSFHDVHKRLPFNGQKGSVADFRMRDSASWAYQILPFMEQEPAFKVPERGRELTFPVYLCPQRRRLGVTTEGKLKGAVTDYALNCWINDPKDGSGSAPNSSAKLQRIVDGTSNTVLVGQLAMRSTDYQAKDAAEGRETFFVGGLTGSGRSGFKPIQDSPDGDVANQFGGPFPRGVLYCMGDASIRQISFMRDAAAIAGALKPDDDKAAPED